MVLPRVLGGGLVVNLSVNPPTQLLPPRQTTIMIQITVVLMYHILCGEQPAQQNRYSEGWPVILGNILMSANSNFGPVDDNFRSRWQTSLSCLGGQSKNIRCVIRYPHPTARNYLRIKNNTTISWSIDHGVCDDQWNDDELGLTSIGLVLDFLPSSSTCPNSKVMEKQQWEIKDMTAVQLGLRIIFKSPPHLTWGDLLYPGV